MLTTKPILSPGVKKVGGLPPFTPLSVVIATAVNGLERSDWRGDSLGLVCEGREKAGI
jgi:hypothetical protein